MTHESDSLNSPLIIFDAYAGDFVPRPVAPEDLPRLLKIWKNYFEAGKIPELTDNPLPTDLNGNEKPSSN